MKIKNFDSLAVTPLRRAALIIAEAGLEAIDTEKVVRGQVRIEGDTLHIGGEIASLKDIGRIVVITVGKCALDAAVVLEKVLGDRLTRGVALYIGSYTKLEKIVGIKGTHPFPSEDNVRGATTIVESLGGLSENDLVIFVISGGGSTLLCLPDKGGYAEEGMILKTLTKEGVTIQEVNVVRKHISLARGGYLAKYAYPARVVSLIFSDVPGDGIQFVASGPTVKDTTTISDAEAILAKYNVLKQCGLEKCGLAETPKEDKYFEKVRNIVAVSNKEALDAMAAKALELGFASSIRDYSLSGEAEAVGLRIAGELNKEAPKTALFYGGETTVTVSGRGRGGRNLELVFSALDQVGEGGLVMSIASDGRDNGEFAGAISDILTKQAVLDKRVDRDAVLKENNEYPTFEEIGHYLVTGDTGSNVSDLIIAIKE
ncbi:MAG: DUF4147 domain-containing protein [Candidatus Liptonbacteria bacterium]|nr:DUF4147 domain-containing protein [Candidatus Liptonbacteria bacterium]